MLTYQAMKTMTVLDIRLKWAPSITTERLRRRPREAHGPTLEASDRALEMMVEFVHKQIR